MAILGPTGEIGKYPNQVHLSEELSLNIYLENHEKQTKLYKIDIKLVENSTLKEDLPPFNDNPVSSYLTVLEDGENTISPIKVVIDQPFNGKIIAELYIFDTSSTSYIYYDRWVAIWMKTTN